MLCSGLLSLWLREIIVLHKMLVSDTMSEAYSWNYLCSLSDLCFSLFVYR